MIGVFSGTGLMGIGGAVKYFQKKRQKQGLTIDIQRAKPDSLVDISEKGRSPDGRIISLDRSLYMQFMAFGAAYDSENFINSLAEGGIQGVLYED